eukprot:GDKH01005163.1.p1 GENE.GDKH01005163.1~~GDKH01005163.1.p1  ORF type:complete len:161 (-),score=5.28 GDKH01005163.1:223-705(-)
MVRFKNRWLAVEVCTERQRTLPSIDPHTFVQAIKESLKENFGDFGLGKNSSTLKVSYFNAETRLAIIRCSRDFSSLVWASLTMLTSLNGQPVYLRVVHDGGTVRSVQEFATRALRNWMDSTRATLKVRHQNSGAVGQNEEGQLARGVERALAELAGLAEF